MSLSLQEISDRLEIYDVLVRYGTALDTRDWPLFLTCFTEDAVLDYGAIGGVHQGPASFVEMSRQFLAGMKVTQHYVSNRVVELDGDSARSSTYGLAQHISLAGEEFLLGCTWADELVRTSDGWRIRHREYVQHWSRGRIEPPVLD